MTASYETSSPRALRSPSDEGRGRVKLEPRAQSALGRELRAMYDGVVSQPVPDRFVELLDQLEEHESRGDQSQSRTTGEKDAAGSGRK